MVTSPKLPHEERTHTKEMGYSDKEFGFGTKLGEGEIVLYLRKVAGERGGLGKDNRKKNLRPNAEATSRRSRHSGRSGRTLLAHIPFPTQNAQAM